MTRRFNACVTGGLSVLALASAMGCEAQVDDEYKGEPLLSLQGNVVVRDGAADADAVPGIAFPKADGDTMIILNGELDGEFPSKFRFDVTQPPPDEALIDAEGTLGSRGKGAFGVLVLAPANLDRSVVKSLSRSADGSCTEDGTACTWYEDQCTPDERCRQQVKVCSEHPCELVEQWGDMDTVDPDHFSSDELCDSETCFEMEMACDAENRCRTDVYRCDFGEYGSFDGESDGVMTTCTTLRTSGDTSFVAVDDLQVAANYGVVYVTEDSPDSLWGPLKRGYNLLALPSTYEAWIEAEKCVSDKMAAAVAEYNEEHGTNYNPIGSDLDYSVLKEAKLSCGAMRLVERPLDEVLTIEMGNIAPQF